MEQIFHKRNMNVLLNVMNVQQKNRMFGGFQLGGISQLDVQTEFGSDFIF